MTEQKKIERIWWKLESGLLISDGTVSDRSESSAKTFLDIKEKALAVEQLYYDNNLPLPDNLTRLIADVKLLSDSWLMGQEKNLPMSLLFHAGLLDRIAETVLALRDVPDRANFLKDLTSGSLDLLCGKRSKAKDTFWELELWAMLKRRSFAATLQEPPDIVVNFGGSRIGIACKKIYSEKHIQNVLSQAVAQIESAFDIGIIAINIDDLVPVNQILTTSTFQTLDRCLDGLNTRFITEHERHFRKYLASGRIISAIVSTSVLADLCKASTRFHRARRLAVWTIPGLSEQKDRQLRNFYDLIMA